MLVEYSSPLLETFTERPGSLMPLSTSPYLGGSTVGISKSRPSPKVTPVN